MSGPGFVALTCDLVDSKEQPDRAELQLRLEAALPLAVGLRVEREGDRVAHVETDGERLLTLRLEDRTPAAPAASP